MLARFFVDRPVFAWVVSIVIVLAGVAAGFTLPIAQYPEITPPTVTVTCAYPGANARVVAETVAAPIEQQVNGVERMLYMSSQSGNDGSYALTVTFELGTDLNIAQVLVQNRVALAQPQLPSEVQRQGLTVKKKSPDILLVVNLFSPEDAPPEYRRDQLYMSNYATIFLRDEIARLTGVGDVTILGQQDYSMRAWLDPDKLGNYGLSANDVVKAIQEQNVQVAAGQIGQQPSPYLAFQYTISTLGRLVDEEQFGEIVVKTANPTGSAAPAGGTGPGAAPQPATQAAGAGANTTNPSTRVRAVVKLKDVVRTDRTEMVRGPDGKSTPTQYRGIELTAKNQDVRSTLNGKPSAGLGIFQLPGSNALATADSVKRKMKDLKARFPLGLDYTVRYDTTPFIRQSVAEVFNTLRDAILLVAVVVLLFLQDWRAMILPMIDVPVALTGTFAVMWAAGFSLNNLTLFGLVLAIGIVVDDAIVVLENIERHVAEGMDARSATIKAMGEITGPIIAITLVLSAVFIPSAFISGISGQFFRQFALTIATAMLISAVNALTLAPARAVAIFKGREKKASGSPAEGKQGDPGHGGHLDQARGATGDPAHDPHAGTEALPWWGWGGLFAWVAYEVVHAANAGPPVAADPTAPPAPFDLAAFGEGALHFAPYLGGGLVLGWFLAKYLNRAAAFVFKWFNKGFTRATNIYGRAVAGLLRVTAVVLVVYAGLLVLTYLGITKTPVGFIPMQDKGYVLVNVQLPDAASLDRTSEVMARINTIVNKTPGVAGNVGITGQSILLGAVGPNFGTMFVTFQDFDVRKEDKEQNGFRILRKLQGEFNREMYEAQVAAFPAPPVSGLGTAGGYKIIVQDRADQGPQALQAATDAFVAKLRETPGAGSAFTQYRATIPQLYAEIDRTKCKQLGVALADVFNTLQVYLGGVYVNDFNKFGRTWQVNVQADAPFRIDRESVGNLQVRNDQGSMVRLGALARIDDTAGPVSLQRYNMYAAASVNGNLPNTTSTGQGITLVKEAAGSLPTQMATEWTELFFLQTQEGNSSLYAFSGAVILVYLILAALYESWTLPLAILMVVPMCVLSSVAGIRLVGLDINIFTQVGFLVLVGLASKNAILIVEFAEDERRKGANLWDATMAAVKTRLRPIIMTSLAFILGVVPLVLATGAGAEMRITLGIAVFSGMIGVTIFGVFLTPVFYYAIERWVVGDKPKGPKKDAAPTPQPAVG